MGLAAATRATIPTPPPAVDWDHHDLCVLTAGNGVPLATAGVSLIDPRCLYVGALCSATHSGGGTRMLDFLCDMATQLQRPTLSLHARPESLAFYHQYGFRAAPDPNASPFDVELPLSATTGALAHGGRRASKRTSTYNQRLAVQQHHFWNMVRRRLRRAHETEG